MADKRTRPVLTQENLIGAFLDLYMSWDEPHRAGMIASLQAANRMAMRFDVTPQDELNIKAAITAKGIQQELSADDQMEAPEPQ